MFQGVADVLTKAGRVCTIITLLALSACVGLLAYCFLTGDMSLEYVAKNHSSAQGSFTALYKLSGIWAGKQGSMLFWAWLISVFSACVFARKRKNIKPIDNIAALIVQVILVAFTSLLLFSESNMPFATTPETYLDSAGNLCGVATSWGMNILLEHWAMAIHPPVLFLGYAGLTIPCAYALSALITGDISCTWIERALPFAKRAWMFLTFGIGLGALWAYSVLGWGGYWSWDPVENASLLPWMMCLSFIHSASAYKKCGAHLCWTIFCACLTFVFVLISSLITRSGIVSSVHSFAGDVSASLLLAVLAVLVFVASVIGLLVRRKHFKEDSEKGVSTPQPQSMLSKEVFFYFNNLIMVLCTLILTYMTISAALPSFLPFGGQSLSAQSYNALARPVGILYLGMLALCPFLSWKKTSKRDLVCRMRAPLIIASVVFLLLMVYFFCTLLPSYNATIAAGGYRAENLSAQGPAMYYNGLCVLGFLIASVLFGNAADTLLKYMRMRKESKRRESKSEESTCAQDKHVQDKHASNNHASSDHVANNHAANNHASTNYASSVAHVAMAVMLVGLISSSMYATQKSAALSFDEDTNSTSDEFVIGDYTLKYVSNSVYDQSEGTQTNDNQSEVAQTSSDEEESTQTIYKLTFDVYKGNTSVGQVNPSIQIDNATNQQKLSTSTLSLLQEDLLVVYKGFNTNGTFSLEAYINPLISWVWTGFVLLVMGMYFALEKTSARINRKQELVTSKN